MATCHFRDKNNKLYTFIHIPKAAGQSITHWIKKNDPNMVWLGAHDSVLDLKKKGITDLGTTFAIVRNPYARAVSAYTYYQSKALSQVMSMKKEIKTDKELEIWNTRYEHTSRMQDYFNTVTFDQWIIDCINDKQRLNLIFRTQVEYCHKVKLVFKVENLLEDITTLNSWFNRDNDLPYANVSNPDKDYNEFYQSKKSKRFIQKYYRDDFIKFGYKL